jgi:hypothetical protein
LIGLEEKKRLFGRPRGLVGLDQHQDHVAGADGQRVGRRVGAAYCDGVAQLAAQPISVDRLDMRLPPVKQPDLDVFAQVESEQAAHRAGADDAEFHESLSHVSIGDAISSAVVKLIVL